MEPVNTGLTIEPSVLITVAICITVAYVVKKVTGARQDESTEDSNTDD